MRQRLSKSSFEATVLPEIGPNTSTVGVDRKVRALPLHNTEDVFNEWGALLRHQDEIDIKIQKENYEKMKLRQQNYKAELDKQYQQLVNRRKGVHGDYGNNYSFKLSLNFVQNSNNFFKYNLVGS